MGQLLLPTEHPILSRIPQKYRDRLLSNIAVTLPLRITAPLVPDEDYWQRKSLTTFKLCNVRAHAGSWKRLFFEKHVQKLLEEFVPQAVAGDVEPQQELWAQLELAAPYVSTLAVRQLRPAGYEPRKEGKDAAAAAAARNGGGPRTTAGDGVRRDHLNVGVVFSKLKNLEDFDVCYRFEFVTSLETKTPATG